MEKMLRDEAKEKTSRQALKATTSQVGAERPSPAAAEEGAVSAEGGVVEPSTSSTRATLRRLLSGDVIPTAEEQMEQIRREAAERKAEKAEKMSRLIAKLDALANARRQAVAANQRLAGPSAPSGSRGGRQGDDEWLLRTADVPESGCREDAQR